ncbi:restriction endonuclease subunit S [Vibrio sp. Isolate34]|uniref:restriction endonuclease subunit S n=1 Tax=Vibrio sp. Isolate34 TaxID=2908540 RepID=UPI001EFD6209|nr:restriction endonuclease subunit S [Vibrio sp. Isolate34]MCG9642096.1 restriction endonuclease subunit S [Vibrio sp. Isolate34]
MGELPKGWAEVSIDDITSDVSYGVTAKSDPFEGDLQLLRITDIQDNRVDWSSVPYCKYESKYESSRLKDNDIVVARTGATVGKSFLIEHAVEDSVYASYLIRLRLTKGTLPKYLAKFLHTPSYWQQISEQKAGIGQPNVNGTKLKTLKMPLAPLAEQKRIVEKLNEVLAQVDTIKARLDGIPDLLKRFRQSVLASAVSGKLTEEWRGGQSLKPWVTLNLNEVTSHVVDCPHSTPKWSDEGRYCVRTTAFNPFYLDLSEQGYVNDEVFAQRTSRLKPESEDILYSREGTVGIACQIPKGVELCLGQRMVVIRTNEKVASKFLTIVLNSDHILRIVRELTIGSTAPRVNMKVIREYPIPVPDVTEQKEIVRLVDQYFAFADTIEAQVKKAQARVDNLTQSILAKAFRGELVAQDPTDEPADKLLERIAVARTEAEALAKAAKKADAARRKAEKAEEKA